MNKISEAIAQIRKALEDYKAQLVTARDAYPDATPLFDSLVQNLDAKIALVDSAFSPAGISAAILEAAKEIAALPKVGLNPNPKPSDVTGG